MEILKKAFLKLYELEELGMPAGRTLENRLRGGFIDLGQDVPPLQTLKLGGSRVVARDHLIHWLKVTGGIEPNAFAPPATSAPARQEEAPGRRGRGRPRKATDSRGAK